MIKSKPLSVSMKSSEEGFPNSHKRCNGTMQFKNNLAMKPVKIQNGPSFKALKYDYSLGLIEHVL